LRYLQRNGLAMTPVNPKHFVDFEFPAAIRAQVPAALRAAYVAVSTLYQTDQIFQARSAIVGKGHVVGWAVDRQFERLIEIGKLPYDCRWVSFEKPTGQYLQIRLGASTMSISQLPEPTALPRHADFRHNRALNNAPFLDLREFDDEREISGLPHLILGHGYQELTFAQVGVLHPNAQRFGWIYRTPNLLELPHVVAVEELTRWAHDHANDDDI